MEKCLLDRHNVTGRGGRLGLMLLGLSAAVAYAPASVAAEVIVNSSGGTIDEAYHKCFWDDFQKETGIEVKSVGQASETLASLQAQVSSNNVLWDLTEIYDTDFGAAVANNLLEKLDLSRLPTQEWEKEWYNDYGVWEIPYGSVLVYNTDKWPDTGPHPTKLTDLWNVEQFPGPRAIQNNPYDNLEFAMEHAGKKNPYPIDFDTAFAELDKLKPHVTSYWTTGAQSMQLMQSGQVDMTTMWSGRAYNLVKEGLPVKIVWDGAVLHVSFWSIPRGAKNQDEAHKLIAYMYDAKNADKNACFAREMGYAVPSKHLSDVLEDEVEEQLATSPANLAVQVILDPEWWNKNTEEASNRWQSWVTQ